MSNPFSQYNAAQGHQRNVDASHRAMRNHQASRSGGSGVGAFFGGLLAVGLLIVFVLVAVSLLGL
jgi:hypothetical protein